MINLISPEQKHTIRAARINVLLVNYALALLSLGVLTCLTYGLGFWIVSQEKSAVVTKIQSQSEQSRTYDAVEKEAEVFRKNLGIAKIILNKEISYSDFLLTLANDMPSGAIITNISLGGTPEATKDGMTLDARTTSYAKVLELKSRLENSELFENTSITNATRPDSISGLSGLAAQYPYEVSYNVKLSKQTAATGVSQ